MTTLTCDFEEVVGTLRSVVDHDWADLINRELQARGSGAPVEWLERGGYQLIYRSYPTEFCKSYDANANQLDMRFSVGLTMAGDGTIQEVMWGSASFEAGLVASAKIQSVNGQDYSNEVIARAIEHAAKGVPLKVTVGARPESAPREVEIEYADGHRFPHLVGIEGARKRIDEIFAPR